ncbi:hypothetical protein C7M61_001103 [Candidozyma pseudohaemuli]|uniref:RING-type domain-containing protein n=1 Tax=Candidozyma pseudohaemuli TaxID=418784 RepID=A0A2P7YZM8_9ASCO|nr:hypothetical protein C7M61_001103 [[Candida] pseudohaemulonii]PSK41421.1 hypothetical protein C7M61_001103 [[Candida] pseudohaemulonii]
MSEQDTKQPSRRRRSSIIEVVSDGENEPGLSFNEQDHRHSIIEVPSDAELDASNDELEIVGEAPAPAVDDDEIQITGQNEMRPSPIQYPGAPMEAVPVDDHREERTPTQTPPTPRPPTRQRSLFGRNPRRNTRRRTAGQLLMERLNFAVPFSFFNLPEEERRTFFNYLHAQDTADEISGAILARLEREDDLALDRKIEKEKIYNRDTLRKKRDEAKEEDNLHTTNITPTENLLCELCGIQLGEGIPDDFIPDPKYNRHLSKYVADNKVQAPWFCVTQCLESDRALSKRVFVGKCGHVFCGRCIKNIGNRAPGRRSKKKDQEVSIDNPMISAPRKCPAADCSHQFSRGKRAFTELFL